MIAIILASGRGVRMGDLTENTPKPMLKVAGKNLIEWKLEALPDGITKIVIVVGYKKEIIINYFGTEWKGIPITYVVQDPIDGTGGGVALCEEYVDDKAIVLYGDDLYKKTDLEKLIPYDYAILVQDMGDDGLKKKGQIIENNGLLTGINEGTVQTGIPSSLIFTGASIISNGYFDYSPVKFTENEFGFPHTLVVLSKDFSVHILRTTEWIQITSPEDIISAEKLVS